LFFLSPARTLAGGGSGPANENPKSFTSLDDLNALLVQKLVAAIGTEELDLFVPKLMPVAIKLALALRAGHPKYFRHSSDPRIFSRKDAKALSLGIDVISTEGRNPS
jgi:hypothetical protein